MPWRDADLAVRAGFAPPFGFPNLLLMGSIAAAAARGVSPSTRQHQRSLLVLLGDPDWKQPEKK